MCRQACQAISNAVAFERFRHVPDITRADALSSKIELQHVLTHYLDARSRAAQTDPSEQSEVLLAADATG